MTEDEKKNFIERLNRSFDEIDKARNAPPSGPYADLAKSHHPDHGARNSKPTQPAPIQRETFTGKDSHDVEQQIWNWRQANPRIKVLKVHPPKELDLRMRLPTPNHGRVAPPQDRVSVAVDYELVR